METSIISETISQQTICGELENIEITNDIDPKLDQSKDLMKIEQTRINLMQAWKVYFKYLSSQRLARIKSSVRCRAARDGKALIPPQLTQQPLTHAGKKPRIPQAGKAMKKICESKVRRF